MSIGDGSQTCCAPEHSGDQASQLQQARNSRRNPPCPDLPQGPVKRSTEFRHLLFRCHPQHGTSTLPRNRSVAAPSPCRRGSRQCQSRPGRGRPRPRPAILRAEFSHSARPTMPTPGQGRLCGTMGAGPGQDGSATGPRGHAVPGCAAPGADRDPTGRLTGVPATQSSHRVTSA